jgi:signal transduction histidine kinase
MFIGDRVIGVISAQSYTENAYRSGDLQMLQLIASQAAVSIQNARLFEAEREQRVLAESLRDTVSILNSTLHFDEVLDHIMDNVGRVVAYDSVSIMLIEGETGIARVVRRRGYAEHRLEAIVLALRFPVSETPSLRFMSETGKPLAISDTQTYAGWVDRVETRWIRSYAGTSIRLKEQVIGFLNLNSAQPGFFTDAHAERLLAFASQAAPAIENARLFEEVSAGRRKLQALSQRLVEVQETERRNIARELHDEIGQTLTGLKLLLDTAHKLPGDRMTARLGEAQAIVNDLIRLARNLSLELRPTMLDDLGLLPALLWLFERYAAQTGVSVNFDHSGVDRRFPSSVETATYRIVQEALTNVARHAQVDHVLVEVRAGDEQLVVKVEDRGVGFDQHAVLGASESGGLIGMRERAFLLGGKLIVESAPGMGTRLIARLPMGDSIEGDESRL